MTFMCCHSSRTLKQREQRVERREYGPGPLLLPVISRSAVLPKRKEGRGLSGGDRVEGSVVSDWKFLMTSIMSNAKGFRLADPHKDSE